MEKILLSFPVINALSRTPQKPAVGLLTWMILHTHTHTLHREQNLPTLNHWKCVCPYPESVCACDFYTMSHSRLHNRLWWSLLHRVCVWVCVCDLHWSEWGNQIDGSLGSSLDLINRRQTGRQTDRHAGGQFRWGRVGLTWQCDITEKDCQMFRCYVNLQMSVSCQCLVWCSSSWAGIFWKPQTMSVIIPAQTQCVLITEHHVMFPLPLLDTRGLLVLVHQLGILAMERYNRFWIARSVRFTSQEALVCIYSCLVFTTSWFLYSHFLLLVVFRAVFLKVDMPT